MKFMKSLKKILSIISLFIICLIVISCGNKKTSEVSNSNDAVVDTASSSKKFVVGFDAEYPPYGYLSSDGKSYEGFDLDMAREFCNRAGYEFVAQPIDWDSKDLELNSGNIDCIWNGFTFTDRENDYTWSVLSQQFF